MSKIGLPPKLEWTDSVNEDGSIAHDEAFIFVRDSEDFEIKIKGPNALDMAKEIVAACNSIPGRVRAHTELKKKEFFNC